jgi:hypothetical protein
MCGYAAKTSRSSGAAAGRGSTMTAAPAAVAATKPAPYGIEPWVNVGPSSTTAAGSSR